MKFDKKHLFTPGPVKMSDQILQIGSQQPPYSRNQEFSELFFECENNLLQIVNASKESRIVFLNASGTGGMEAVVMNLLNQDDFALVVNGGGFGQRFVEMCLLHNIPHTNIPVFNDNLSDASAMNIHKDVSSLLINAHETTTGTLYDLESVGSFCEKNDLLFIVDAIGMFLTDELDMKKQHIDVAIVTSNKGLALPPGLCMVVLSPKAIKHLQYAHSYYFNFLNYLADGQRGQTPFTPPISIFMQLSYRLKQVIEKGVENEIAKTKKLADYFRQQIKPLPLKVYSNFMPNALTALTPTDNKSAFEIVKILDEEYNISVAPNGGVLKDKVFRVSHMGDMTIEYTDILIDALFDLYGRKR